MRLKSWGYAALVALMASLASVAQSAEEVDGASASPTPGNFESDMAQADLGGGDSCSTCASGCCDAGGWGLKGLMRRPIQVVAGAQYIYAKASFSEALAYVENNANTGTTTFHCYDFNYNSSYNLYGGFYLCDCGGSVLFNFTRLNNSSEFAAQNSQGVNIFTPYEIDDNVRGRADVDLKSYDLSFAKTIPLGCPLQCGSSCDCGDSCCEDSCCGGAGGCGCGWCPAWDIQWSGGVRFADVNWNRGTQQFGSQGETVAAANTRMDFNGFGGRVGLLGRRYLGRRGLVSLYAKGDWSLLYGDISTITAVTIPDAGTAFINNSCQRLIPVTEIELGGTVHLGCHASASAGYFWAAWHDLGMSDQYDFNQFQVSHYDDANILGFNGLFARFQFMF